MRNILSLTSVVVVSSVSSIVSVLISYSFPHCSLWIHFITGGIIGYLMARTELIFKQSPYYKSN